MEIVVTNYGLEPDVELVKEYIKETMNTFTDVEKLEEVEKFALWVICKYIPLPDENGQ